MSNRRNSPEDELDVEGHGHRRADTKATTPSEPGTGPEGLSRKKAVEPDVEGHSMLQNPALTRNVVQSREREIQRHLRQDDLKSEVRRPFRKEGR
jgi:hypothetical protein